MIYYLWVFILAIICLLSLVVFLVSITKDIPLLKKLKKKKSSLLLNITLLIISTGSLALIIALFMELKRQIDIYG